MIVTIDQKALSQYYHAFTSVTDSSIAQSVEQRTVNPCVPGSSPGRGANEYKPHSDVGLFHIYYSLINVSVCVSILNECVYSFHSLSLILSNIYIYNPKGLLLPPNLVDYTKETL